MLYVSTFLLLEVSITTNVSVMMDILANLKRILGLRLIITSHIALKSSTYFVNISGYAIPEH